MKKMNRNVRRQCVQTLSFEQTRIIKPVSFSCDYGQKSTGCYAAVTPCCLTASDKLRQKKRGVWAGRLQLMSSMRFANTDLRALSPFALQRKL